ncbi:MAG: TrmH family RNA methyltransferase [Bacillales bacterium]
MIKTIESKNNQLIKYVLKLRNNKYIKEEEKFIIEGEHLLEMALNKNKLLYVLTLNKLDIDSSIDQFIINEEIMSKISLNKSIPKVIGICKFNNNNINTNEDIIYLDNIQDPGNFGTIIRTSLAFGCKNIVINSNNVSLYNQKTIQASQGAIFDISITTLDENEIINFKNKNRYKLITTILDKNSININKFHKNNNEKYIICFGNEGNGINPYLINNSDYKLYIPIKNIESLNVGIAHAIVLFNLNIL